MFILDGFVNLKLNVNGVEIGVGPGTVKGLSIIQNMQNLTPILEGKIVDVEKLHAQSNLFNDGAKIIVNIGPGVSSTADMKFRRFNNADIKNGNNGDLITFSAQLDMPKIRDVQKKSMQKMSSHDVISKFAGELGIRFDGDMTSDIMTWLPSNRPLGQWLRHVSDHGFASAQSAMAMMIAGKGDGNWVMRYKDLVKQIQKPATARFISEGYGGRSDVSIKTVQARSHSGSLNNTGNYNSVTQETTKSGEVKQHKQVEIVKSMLDLDISSVVKSAIAELPTFFFPIDAGNVHDNFAKAKHQNERIKQSFTSFLDVMTMDYTNIMIGDPVEAIIIQGGVVNKTESGKYIVQSRTQHAAGSSYRERFVLAAQGANAGKSGS